MKEKNTITKSWDENAQEWIRIIDSEMIPSRKFTNRAVVQTLRNLEASKILDVGCGEGWLTREITQMGKVGIGLDAIEALLENARIKGPQAYYLLSYEAIIAGELIPDAPFEAIVCNFCLYDKDSLAPLLSQLKKFLSKDGKIVIQTLHPFFLTQQDIEYKSQWLGDAWKGLPGKFKNGHSWYARTMEDWVSVIRKAGMGVAQLNEVVDGDKKPISMILILKE
ncbi:MAG: class I SAM-dependent methyltransferase [Bacteroidota bacterium]